MATVTFDNVSKRYPTGQVALRGLDLAVADGEFLVLVGPSGCGKSTALRLVAGLEDISEGRLLIGGRLANDAPPRARNIAMVFQSYALYPHLSVAENLGFGLRVRGASAGEIARKVREVAATLELGDLLARRPAQLSGGQRQRVAMGRALVRSPNAFLMDEPLSNLDARLRGQMRAEIAALQKRTGVTTIYVTHDQVEAMTMGTRVAVLNRGVLQQVGPPRALYDGPENLFVAGFIGSPAMNFLAGTLGREGEALVLHLGSGRIALGGADAAPSAPADGGDRAVIAGIRPEAFRLVPGGGAGALSGLVRFVEDLGATRLVSVDLEAARLVGSVEDTEDAFVASHKHLRVLVDGTFGLAAGDRIVLTVDPARIHFFDPRSGQAVRSTRPLNGRP